MLIIFTDFGTVLLCFVCFLFHNLYIKLIYHVVLFCIGRGKGVSQRFTLTTTPPKGGGCSTDVVQKMTRTAQFSSSHRRGGGGGGCPLQKYTNGLLIHFHYIWIGKIWKFMYEYVQISLCGRYMNGYIFHRAQYINGVGSGGSSRTSVTQIHCKRHTSAFS